MRRDQVVITYPTYKLLNTVSERSERLYQTILDVGEINDYDHVVFKTTRAELGDMLQCSDRSISRSINELIDKELMISKQTKQGILLVITTGIEKPDQKTKVSQKGGVFGNPQKELATLKPKSPKGLTPEKGEKVAILEPPNKNQDTFLVDVNQRTDVNQSTDVRKSTKRKKTKKDQTMLDLPRAATDAPVMPVKISDIADQSHEFPYRGVGVMQSVLFYWALERYRLHRIDTMISKSLLTTISLRFGTVVKQLGTEWDSLRKYVDWYLSRSDAFTRKTCQYNVNFLTSTTCYNQYLEGGAGTVKMYSTPEERKGAKSVWIRE